MNQYPNWFNRYADHRKTGGDCSVASYDSSALAGNLPAVPRLSATNQLHHYNRFFTPCLVA
jgi:hypothetical protein